MSHLPDLENALKKVKTSKQTYRAYTKVSDDLLARIGIIALTSYDKYIDDAVAVLAHDKEYQKYKNKALTKTSAVKLLKLLLRYSDRFINERIRD